MSKCTKCGAGFVGIPEDPPKPDHLCVRCENAKLKEELVIALTEIERLHELLDDEGACHRYRLEKKGIYVQEPRSLFSPKHDNKDFMPPVFTIYEANNGND